MRRGRQCGMSTLRMDEECGVSRGGRGRGESSMLCVLLTRQSHSLLLYYNSWFSLGRCQFLLHRGRWSCLSKLNASVFLGKLVPREAGSNLSGLSSGRGTELGPWISISERVLLSSSRRWESLDAPFGACRQFLTSEPALIVSMGKPLQSYKTPGLG